MGHNFVMIAFVYELSTHSCIFANLQDLESQGYDCGKIPEKEDDVIKSILNDSDVRSGYHFVQTGALPLATKSYLAGAHVALVGEECIGMVQTANGSATLVDEYVPNPTGGNTSF